jgi:hypothetical protein
MAAYRKAIVAVVGAVVAVLATQGVDVDPEVTQGIIGLATAALVYFVRND